MQQHSCGTYELQLLACYHTSSGHQLYVQSGSCTIIMRYGSAHMLMVLQAV